MAKKENLVFLANSYLSEKGNQKLTSKLYDGLIEWYFGSKECTVEICAKRAYEDLQRNLRGISGMEQEKKQSYKNEIYLLISKSINELFEMGTLSEEKHDEWHMKTCEKICEYSKKLNTDVTNKFTYGLAQKWLNMTFKYMLITEQWDTQLSHIKQHLHIPVDSYVMEGACFILGIKIIDNKGKLDQYNSDRSKPWSSWNCEEYIEFQKRVRKAVTVREDYKCPIDWEFNAWITIKNMRGQ